MPDFGDVNPDTGATNARTDFSGSYDPLAPSVANGGITPEQWHEYQMKRRRDAILGILGTFAGTVGLGAAGAAARGGAAAAGASGSAAGAGGASAGAGSASLPAAATAGMLPMSVAGPAVGAGAGVGAGSGAAGILGNLSARDIAALGLTGASALGGAMSNRNTNTNPNTMTSDPQMREMLDLMMGRVRKSEPLYDSVLAMANGLLPTQYQKGGGGMG